MKFKTEDYTLFSEEERLKLRKTHKFSETNMIWNKYCFNQKKSVGSLMNLIRESNAFTKAEWSDYYFKSGIDAKIKRRKINSERYWDEMNRKRDLINLAKATGKTMEDLMEIAYHFKNKLDIDIPHNELSLNDVFNFVYTRVIDETYIGFSREREAMRQLTEFCKPYGFTCSFAAEDIDSEYGIDIEIKDTTGKLLMGVQVKSENVFMQYKDIEMGYSHPELAHDYTWQQEKHSNYTRKFGSPVEYLFLNNQYEVVEAKVFKEINKLKDIKAKEKNNILPITAYYQYEGFVAAPIYRNPSFKNNEFFNSPPSALLNTMNEMVRKYGSDKNKIIIQSSNIEETNVKIAYILKYIPNYDIKNIIVIKPFEILSLCETDKLLFTCSEDIARKWHEAGGQATYYKKTTAPTELNYIDAEATLKQIEEAINICYKKTLDKDSLEYRLINATDSIKENFIKEKEISRGL